MASKYINFQLGSTNGKSSDTIGDMLRVMNERKQALQNQKNTEEMRAMEKERFEFDKEAQAKQEEANKK